MKLRTRLKITFFTITIVPLILISAMAWVLLSYQARNINSDYGIEDANVQSVANTIEIATKISNKILSELQSTFENSPELVTDKAYLVGASENLKKKATDLIICKEDKIFFVGRDDDYVDCDMNVPDYSALNETAENGFYYDDTSKSIIRFFDVNTDSDGKYVVFLVTYLDNIASRLKFFWVESIISIFIILLIISGIMTAWIYRATIIPLNRLKEATHDIAEGNLDFVLESKRNDEIGELCKDFEFMRQKLKESAEENLQSERESKELISNISHDLKTPITAIKGYVEGLRDGIAVTEEKREKYLKTIYNKAVEMDKLIDELTLYSKIDTNRIPYCFDKISVNEFFSDCKDSLMAELESKGVDFFYSNSLEENVEFIVDAEQLGRVINNIISNSLKYHADRKLVVNMRIRDEGDFIRVEIQDNGKGISKNDLPHIFDRLYRADASRNSAVGGSGIGLSIVKKIIEDHGGRIWAESIEGEGTTMCFVIRKYFGGNNEQNINN
ncbi:MAG: ATP-binding protein [Lachnospiraceae bacterium]